MHWRQIAVSHQSLKANYSISLSSTLDFHQRRLEILKICSNYTDWRISWHHNFHYKMSAIYISHILITQARKFLGTFRTYQTDTDWGTCPSGRHALTLKNIIMHTLLVTIPYLISCHNCTHECGILYLSSCSSL